MKTTRNWLFVMRLPSCEVLHESLFEIRSETSDEAAAMAATWRLVRTEGATMHLVAERKKDKRIYPIAPLSDFPSYLLQNGYFAPDVVDAAAAELARREEVAA